MKKWKYMHIANSGCLVTDDDTEAGDESEFYAASDVDARIAELEKALRNMLALVDEIDTSSGEEVKGVVYYESKKALGL